jgi:hypothetical protein
MIGTPVGLYYLFGVLMLAVAAYSVVLLVPTVFVHRVLGRDVEISHVAMGVAMAGMFVPGWSFGPKVFWEMIFGALLVWFIVRSLQSIQAWGLHVPHTAVHAVMSFVMLLMYWFPAGAVAHAMSMSASAGGARIDPGLTFLLAFILFGSAIFTIASPNKGATHYGTHCGGIVRAPASDAHEGTAAPAMTGIIGLAGSPSLLDTSHVIMSVGMGLMLILMF